MLSSDADHDSRNRPAASALGAHGPHYDAQQRRWRPIVRRFLARGTSIARACLPWAAWQPGTDHGLRRAMRRLLLGNLLIVLGAIVLALGIGTVAYADWAERQHAARAPAVPSETLPSRIDTSARAQTLATATIAATPWPTAALPPPTLPPTPSRPTLEPTYTVSAPAIEPAAPAVSTEAPPVVASEEPSVVALAPTATRTTPPSYGPAVSMA